METALEDSGIKGRRRNRSRDSGKNPGSCRNRKIDSTHSLFLCIDSRTLDHINCIFTVVLTSHLCESDGSPLHMFIHRNVLYQVVRHWQVLEACGLWKIQREIILKWIRD